TGENVKQPEHGPRTLSKTCSVPDCREPIQLTSTNRSVRLCLSIFMRAIRGGRERLFPANLRFHLTLPPSMTFQSPVQVACATNSKIFPRSPDRSLHSD